jgi:hypothetical protein
MTKYQSLLIRIILFFVGAGIVILAFFLTTGGRILTGLDSFTWASIGSMYLVFFAPFFSTSLNRRNFSGKIPRIALVWAGVGGYILISCWIIRLAWTGLPVRFAVILQAALAFLFLVDVFFAFLASSHVRRIASQEARKTELLNEAKGKARTLSLAVNALPAEYEAAAKAISDALEDIRYLSPLDGRAGEEQELAILASLGRIGELCQTAAEGGHPNFAAETGTLTASVRLRKMLRN